MSCDRNAEISESPRPADISQLRSAYLLHRQECQVCTPAQPCEMARRLEEARRAGEGVVSACAECARLEREKETARKAGDLSKVTDCDVLLRRHPDHQEHTTRPYRSEAGTCQ
jgi:hypothetical protein